MVSFGPGRGIRKDMDLDRLVGELASTQHGAFSASQLPSATPSTLRTRTSAGRWRRVRRGVFVIAGSPDTWEQRLWIRLLMAGPGAVVGARSAGVLHQLRGLKPGALDIIQPEESAPYAKRNSLRRTNQLPKWQVTEARGFPVVTPERALFDIAGLATIYRRRAMLPYVSEYEVARLVDNAITQKLITVRSMRHVHLALAGRGRPGSRLMREILDERGAGHVPTESELEDAFIRLVKDFDLPSPRRQVTLGPASGAIGRVDFYYAEARLVVEADSHAFHSQRTQVLADHRRDMEFLANGWQVLRVDWQQLTKERAQVARLLRRILDQRTVA